VVYHGVERPQRSSEGYRVLLYRSSQKEEQDRHIRQQRLERARTRLEGLQASGRREFRTEAEARVVAERILVEERVEGLLVIEIVRQVDEQYRQARRGRPGPNTEYRRVERSSYRIRFEENAAALVRESRCDGLFPLMTNDESLSLSESLSKYKYQPFVEKRHEQLKSVFGVMPVWLKNVERVASLLWLYYVVELVQALAEREVRRQMARQGVASLALYPEGRASEGPTTELVFNALEGLRRHRLLDERGEELRRFHDELPAAGREVLELLAIAVTPYGLT
jgi:transposase